MQATFKQQISVAAHQDLAYANPLSAAQMQSLIQAALQHRASKALEIGCGNGAFALALAQQAPIQLTALDINPLSLAHAQANAKQTPLLGELIFLESDAQSAANTEPYELIICLGASQAFGTPRQALLSLNQRLAKGGMLIFAELIWAQVPTPEFLDFLQVHESDYWPASQAESIFQECGLQLQQSLSASAQSWQEYEAAVMAGRLRFADTLDNPAQAEQVRQMAQTWQTAYQTHGHCLGFDGYVALKTAC